MKQKYDNVALELGVGVTIRSASAFKTDPVAVSLTAQVPAAASVPSPPTAPDPAVKFLGDHWDTHVLSITFFSLSSKDSFVKL